MRRSLTLLTALLLLGGCATRYQSAGLTGGHEEKKGPGKLEMVQFYANGYTSADLAEKYGLYRCAEYAAAKGKRYFILYETLSHAAHERPSAAPRIGIVQNKPIASAYVLLLDGPAPGAQEAKTVMAALQYVIDTGKVTQS